MSCVTGGLAAATDIMAGEKEKGTLEALLTHSGQCDVGAVRQAFHRGCDGLFERCGVHGEHVGGLSLHAGELAGRSGRRP